MSYSKKAVISSLIICIMLSFTTVFCYAEDGDGTGGGSGRNRDIPLSLQSSSVKDGDTGVALNETVQLDFNKNICNITVLANNKQCFHLTDADGSAVPIRLIFPDNQVQKEYRRQVFIQPQSDLSPETSYRIAVDNTLMAKNGTYIDNAYTISFTTGTGRTDKENTILRRLGDYTVTYETASGENENSIPVNVSGLDDPENDTISAATAAKIAAAVILAVIIVFTVLIIMFRRKKR